MHCVICDMWCGVCANVVTCVTCVCCASSAGVLAPSVCNYSLQCPQCTKDSTLTCNTLTAFFRQEVIRKVEEEYSFQPPTGKRMTADELKAATIRLSTRTD